MMEEALNVLYYYPFPRILVCNAIQEARQERPEQVGLRPKRVFPSSLREDGTRN